MSPRIKDHSQVDRRISSDSGSVTEKHQYRRVTFKQTFHSAKPM